MSEIENGSAASGVSAEEAQKHMFHDGHRWLYKDPASGNFLTWNESENKWTFYGAALPNTDTALNQKTGAGGDNSSANDVDDDAAQRPDEDDFAYQLRLERCERKRLEKMAQLSAEAQSAETGQGAMTFVDKDGITLEWDPKQRAWVPKIDEDFLAKYQSNYGVAQPVESVSNEASEVGVSETTQGEVPDDKQKGKKRKGKPEEQKGWFQMDDQMNTNVYVSNLPLDITMDEFKELMQKCGIIAKDLNTQQLRLKLYRDEEGNVKGDGRCGYIKRESVDLALTILDDSEIRGKRIRVERAHFEQKGNFDPTKKKKRLPAKMRKKMMEKQEKLLDWRPEKLRGERPRSDSVVVLKNVFTTAEFLGNETLLYDIDQLLQQECSKYGEVKKVTIYDNHPDGVATVSFRDAEQADDCIIMFDYRVLRGRKIRAERWDGKTKFKMQESTEVQEERLQHWSKYLEEDDEGSSPAAKKPDST